MNAMSNNKPTVWAVLAALAFMLKENPELVSFLDPALSTKILGIAAIICAFLSGRYITYTIPTIPTEKSQDKAEPSKPNV